MTSNYTEDPWPGPNERQVVDEMIQDKDSLHWRQCLTAVSQLAERVNIPPDLKEEVVQSVMISLLRDDKKALRNFHYRSKLTTWLGTIVVHQAFDVLRSRQGRSNRETSLDTLQNSENDTESSPMIMAPGTTEKECILREELHEILIALQDLSRHHPLSDRDRAIIDMAFCKGYKCDEIAKELDIDYSKTYYVVDRTRRYLRRALQHKPPK